MASPIVAPRTGGAQSAARTGTNRDDTAAQRRDSLRARREGERAQAAFETTRQYHLPRTPDADGPPCDVQVGRFCYWHRPDELVAPEPRVVTAARERLLRTLDQLHIHARGDPWLAGQRVRYLVEAGDDSSALLAAQECVAAVWWCGALRGFALHAAQRYTEAEAVFDSALAAMPPTDRCRWRDLSLLLPAEERPAYNALPCDRRAEFERHYWQLADPSYAIPGNDRRTEHFARVVLATLSETSRNAYGIPWGSDMRELLIRYGAPVSYSAPWPVWSETSSPVIGHEREPSYHFAAVASGSDTARWDVLAASAPERYAPMYIDTLVELGTQFAMFKRGDSALVVAAYATRAGRGEGSTEAQTVLGVADSGVVTSATGKPDRRVRSARVGWHGVVAGIEQYDAATKRMARARVWLAPPMRAEGAPQLSTMLLFAGDTGRSLGTNAMVDSATTNSLSEESTAIDSQTGDSWVTDSIVDSTTGASAAKNAAPRNTTTAGPAKNGTPNDTLVNAVSTESLDAALRSALTTSTVDKRRPLGVYWEMYDLPSSATPADTALSVSITVERTGGGVLQRLAQALHLSPTERPMGVRWHDATGRAIASRSVQLDLRQLPGGTYRITLAVGPDPRHQSTTARDVTLH